MILLFLIPKVATHLHMDKCVLHTIYDKCISMTAPNSKIFISQNGIKTEHFKNAKQREHCFPLSAHNIHQYIRSYMVFIIQCFSPFVRNTSRKLCATFDSFQPNFSFIVISTLFISFFPLNFTLWSYDRSCNVYLEVISRNVSFQTSNC